MENRFSRSSKWVSERRAVPRENNDDHDDDDDDDWKVGAWRSATGVCKITRGWREKTAARRKRGLSREESSFERLDLRAAEVLERSMQALESSTSLTSCASGMTADSPHWKGGGGGWEVQKSEQEVLGKRYDWDPSQRLHSCRRGGSATTKLKGFDGGEHDKARVLKDMVNSNVDYGVKMSTTLAKTPDDTINRMPVKDPNVLKVEESTFEEGQLSYYARERLWNGPRRERVLDGGQELPSPASRDMFKKGADGDGRIASSGTTRDATSGTAATLDRLTQTELAGLSGCKMLPPKGKRVVDSRPPTKPKGEQVQIYMKFNSERRRKRSLKNNNSEQRKLIFPSKPPRCKGLSTALSVMRSMCHGAGEAGVVDAQARPLLIIAGKCVFRTTEPLDTPRLCNILDQRKCSVQRASNVDEESLPPPGSADVSSEDTRKASSHHEPASKSLLPRLRSFDGPLSTIPYYDMCQSTSASIKHWPAVLTELDNWISQIVNDWLDKDERLAAANSSLSQTSVTSGSKNLSSTTGACTEEKVGVSTVLPVSNIMEVSKGLIKPLPKTFEEPEKPMSVPSKKLTELNAKIGGAQNVRDLSQLLEPISQASPSAIPGRKVVGDMKISPTSIIQEFGEDDAVQEFQRQIHNLERENDQRTRTFSMVRGYKRKIMRG